MLIAFTKKQFPTEYIPTVFDNYETTVKVDGKNTFIGLWDVSLFIVCVCVKKRESNETYLANCFYVV